MKEEGELAMGRDPISKPTNGSKKRDPAASRRTFKATQEAEGADWTNAEAAVVVEAIATVGYRGGALRFGYTSDGGAYSIGIYGDGDPYTHYVRPGEDITQVLRELIEYFRSE